MTALVRAEILKARTTRTAVALALGLLAIIVFFGNVHAATLDASETGPDATGDNLGGLAFTPFFALIFGILASAGEHRHGTLSQTYLVAPVRERVLAAKVVAAMLFAVMLWAVAAALAIPTGAAWFAARGFDYSLGEAWTALWPTLILAALWAALGIGLGFALPNQVGAIVLVFAWLSVVEGIVSGLLPGVRQYLPGGLVEQFASDDPNAELSRPVAGLLTAAWAAGLCAVGAALERRRDVT